MLHYMGFPLKFVGMFRLNIMFKNNTHTHCITHTQCMSTLYSHTVYSYSVNCTVHAVHTKSTCCVACTMGELESKHEV